ncbi:pentapeptide repeat-containing protein [Rhodococcus sp. OK302]|uniref:pentapeptide repeat-containing protein n=1 Tax=Rhodococcus sp. OK302 TaxID=1882769 RepID=UPI000B93F8F4|nr:pentapeptide repeat-containing protein [Rhodococcus sp. OK302]OYD61272.1 uncharacterized protein YjbI with pentapeptide repeats [Rhodococcus sp. OK302]
MTTADSPDGDSPVDKLPVLAPPPGSRGTRIGFFAGTALATVSVALFIVSGFAILSGDSGVAQPVATVLGGAGVLGAGVLTFRSAHNTRISAEKTAAEQLTHAAIELEHAQSVAADEKARHEKQFEEQRQQAELSRAEQAQTFERTYKREVIRDLRSRYTTCAEQLAHDSAAIRLAGVYALASLADDWQQQNERDEKQVALDLLRAYLRTPNTHTPALVTAELPDTGELEVRKTILLTLHKRSTAEASDPKSWKGFDCTISGADISNLNLTSSDLPGAVLWRVNLSGANLTAAHLTSANLGSADLAGADLTWVNLSGSDLFGADLTGAILVDADLTSTNLAHAKLSSANLSGANLTSANLTRVNLLDAVMFTANLSGANLSGGKLSGADLTGANLSGANLTGGKLSGADLTEANLTEATLVDAELMNADLTEANLTNANLHGANLAGAKIERANLSHIYWTALTIWPEGFSPPTSRERP